VHAPIKQISLTENSRRSENVVAAVAVAAVVVVSRGANKK
jgi:hypothetical protein